MQSLLDAKYQKKITILNKIFHSKNHACSQDVLLEDLGITYPTLISTIEKINSEVQELGYEDFAIVHKPANQLFILELKEDLNIQRIVSYYLKKSLKFKLLEVLLTSTYPTMKQLADKLNVSYVSVRQSIKQVNELLKENHVWVSTENEVAITGNERGVRLFYTFLFLSVYGGEKWPFAFIHYFGISTFLTNCPEEIYLAGTIDKSVLIHYYVAVHLLRDKCGYFLSEEETQGIPLYAPYSTEAQESTIKLVAEMKKYVHRTNEGYLQLTTSVLLSSILALGSYSTIDKPPAFFYSDEPIRDSGFLDLISYVVDQVENGLAITFSVSEKNKLYYALMSSHYRLLLFKDFDLDLEPVLPAYVKKSSKSGNKHKLQQLSQLIDELLESEEFISYEAIKPYLKKEYMIILDKRIDLAKHMRPIKAAILTFVSNEFLSQEFYTHFSPSYNIVMASHLEKDIDLFVSDFQLSQEVIHSLRINQPIVYVHNRLVESDYEKLSDRLAKIAESKLID